MRFRYAFQKIVDLKMNEKTQAEWMLSEAIGRMKQEESSLVELEHSKRSLQEELQEASTRSISVSDLLLMQSYVDYVDTRIQEKHTDIQLAKTVVQSKQDDLTGKMLQEKVWAKAKEKAFQRFSFDVMKKEQDGLDEMATNRYKAPSAY
ncbi:flagellar export protein FliJ [Paenibacillus sp. S-38]|uniref:flagellar export protein FliJ n=1 Tax=Paenibacillus sp. S-38 TaxID=3416710 RepID=UPI003CF8F0FE